MKRILITGGAGFIGSHLVEKLIDNGHHVTIIDDLSTGDLSSVSHAVNFYNRNLFKDDVDDIFETELPNIVFHLAAESSVAKSVENPLLNTQRNVVATVSVLECARKYNVEKVLFTSSAAVYGTPQSLPINEGHDLTPLSPYGLSKKTCEEYIRMYHSLYGVNYTIFRLANIYGLKNDISNAEDVISSMLAKCLEREPIFITGNGEQTRDFLNVRDTVDVLERSISSLHNDTYNLCSGNEVSIRELYSILKTHYPSLEAAEFVQDREGDIDRSVLDHSKLNRDLCTWNPKYTLEKGVSEILDQALLVNN